MDRKKVPPAQAAVAAFPHLQAQAGRSLEAQARRVAERTAHFIPRRAVVRALDERARASGGGLIALEGPPGSGATALLCHLAATRACAFWLPEEDVGAGLEALCAQILALCGLPVALVPPAAGRDTLALERLLDEAGAARPASDPLLVLIGRPAGPQAAPLPPPFLAQIPRGVVVVLACEPKSALPLRPSARVSLPTRGVRLEQRLAQAGIRLGCAPEAAALLARHSRGSFLYVRLAAGLLRAGLVDVAGLPDGLHALHQVCWAQLDDAGRQLAALIAAAGEPIAPAVLADLAGVSTDGLRGWLRRWRPFLELVDGRVRLYHRLTRDFVAAQLGDDLASAHAAFVALARDRSDGQFERLRDQADGYLVSQIARHASLADPPARSAAFPALASRSWAVARERASGTMRAAAQDLAWVLRATAADDDPLQLVRHATLAGTLALLGRTLPLNAPAEIFEAAVSQGGPREAMLRRVRAMVDQLPDGRDKALVLRRLGEVCYTLRMRASAMRMLSEALDLEAPGPTRAWRDEREETLVAFARAAIAIEMPQTALGITARIGHAERRGMIETEAMRWLLARDLRTRAEEVAYAIGHVAMHEWAMAEVAVAHARAGDVARGETVLSTLKTETAIAWARGELACDAARHGDPHAAGRLAPLTNPSLCDRALALVAQALVAGGQPEAAVETARMAEDRVVRAQALIDIATQQPPNAAAALTCADADIAELSGDDRAPLVAALAAAQATIERLETALQTVARLPEDEERDRAQSRVAVALARRGHEADARIVAEAIGDDDERDWAFDELARYAAGRGDWQTAFALAAEIIVEEQRARTQADLAIGRARAGDALAAHAVIEQIGRAGERARAFAAITGPLVEQDARAHAIETLAFIPDPDQRSRYQAALAAALAEHGELVGAQGVARSIARPLDRARALVSIARAAVAPDRRLASQSLGEALQIAAALGRSETFKCLEWAADTLAQIGSADLLLAAASALDEIDSWWV